MKIYFDGDKAYAEIAEGYLVYIGHTEFVKFLSPMELFQLITETIKEIKVDEM